MPGSLESERVGSRPIKLLLANLPASIAGLLHSVLENVSDFQILRAPVALSVESAPFGLANVLLLGSFTDDGTGRALKILDLLEQKSPRPRVLVIAENPDYRQTVALFRAGANGILCGRDLQIDLLCKSVRCVHEGQLWANDSLLQHLVASLRLPKVEDVRRSRIKALLTSREHEVLELVADGMSNSEIASRLRLSEHTVKNHLFRIYDKLGVSNRVEATLYFHSPDVSPMSSRA